MKRIASRFLIAIGMVILTGGWAHTAAAQGAAPPDFLVTVQSAQDFGGTLTALQQAIEGENLMVVSEVNPQQMLRMVGMQTGGMRQLFVFHPRYMRRIIETNPNGGIEPPLKFLVMEAPNGDVMVRYHDPVHQFASYQGLSEIAAELRGVLDNIVDSVRQ